MKKKTNYIFISCFEVVGKNDAYVIYCFIECGYHTLLIILHVFDYFFVNIQLWNAKFQDVNEKKGAIYNNCDTKISKKLRKIECSKKWSGQAPLTDKFYYHRYKILFTKRWVCVVSTTQILYDTCVPNCQCHICRPKC